MTHRGGVRATKYILFMGMSVECGARLSGTVGRELSIGTQN